MQLVSTSIAWPRWSSSTFDVRDNTEYDDSANPLMHLHHALFSRSRGCYGDCHESEESEVEMEEVSVAEKPFDLTLGHRCSGDGSDGSTAVIGQVFRCGSYDGCEGSNGPLLKLVFTVTSARALAAGGGGAKPVEPAVRRVTVLSWVRREDLMDEEELDDGDWEDDTRDEHGAQRRELVLPEGHESDSEEEEIIVVE